MGRSAWITPAPCGWARHEGVRGPARSRHPARDACRRWRADGRAILPHRRHAAALRSRTRPRFAAARWSGDPVARRFAREPARARSPVRRRLRRRLAGPFDYRPAAARIIGRSKSDRALADDRIAARHHQPTARALAQCRGQSNGSDRGHSSRWHSLIYFSRTDRRSALRRIAPWRPAACGARAAADHSHIYLRRVGGKRGDCRGVGIRPRFHHSLRADLGKCSDRPVCRGRRAPARTGIAMPLIDLANPTRFVAFVARVLPWLMATTVLAFAAGTYMTITAPDDYQMGATGKIMFPHVPAARLGVLCWG